ncbi:hypothetical protein [Prosthecobacter sp.]|uniref:hypothetical protein n=1 Tax=Prosthecobacter sp. TaxID=1965333 RepID=UPI0025EB36F1|nr:hypothetical protein [Prosthecobacter sp.]
MFAYTFFAKQHLTDHARGFVTERTLAYSKSTVGWVEKGLGSPLAAKLISPEKKQVIEAELAKYHRDPAAYITSVTHREEGGSDSTESGKVEQFKQKIRNYYQSTLAELVIDLRIFTGSNVVAGLAALILLWSRHFRGQRQVEVFSLFIFASVAISSYLYLDGLSFFRILFKWHLGWSYPGSVALTAVYLYQRYGKKQPQAEQTDAGRKRSAAP